MPDPSMRQITVTMSRALWEALLSIEPFARESYTGPGVAIFNAFQQVRQQTGIEQPGAPDG